MEGLGFRIKNRTHDCRMTRGWELADHKHIRIWNSSAGYTRVGTLCLALSKQYNADIYSMQRNYLVGWWLHYATSGWSLPWERYELLLGLIRFKEGLDNLKLTLERNGYADYSHRKNTPPEVDALHPAT